MARFRYLLWIMPAIGLIMATVAFTARRGGVLSWLRAVRLVDTVQVQLEACGGPREVLWGDVGRGEAFDHYRKALSQVAALTGRDWQQLLSQAVSQEEGALEAAHTVMSDPRARLCVGALTRGAHAETCGPHVDWTQPWETTPVLTGATDVERIAFAQALVLLDSGQDIESVQVLLDALQFGADLAEAPIAIAEILGTNLLGRGRVEALISVRGWAAMDPGARHVLSHGLGILDQRLSFCGQGDTGEFISNARVMELAFRETDVISLGGEDVGRALAAEFVQIRARQLERVRWAIDVSPADGLRAVATDAKSNARSSNVALRHLSYSRDSLGQRTAHLMHLRAALAGVLAFDKSNKRRLRDALDHPFDILVTESFVRVRTVGDETDQIEVTLRR